MQENNDRSSLSSHTVILRSVTHGTRVSFSSDSIENPLPPTTPHQRKTINEPRPDMITIYRRLYMAEQFNNVSATTHPTQDQYAIRNIRL